MKLVLDTNVVIDWLVFDDPYLAPFRDAVERREITVLTQSHALEELQRVLAYRALKLDASRQEAVLEQYRESTVLFSRAATSASEEEVPKGFPRCRDPDDAPFLSLAWHSKAHALVSRDNEVLALRRRAVRFGFRILNVPQMMECVVALNAGGQPAA